MKQNIGPGVIIGVLVVVVAIIGFIGFKALFHDPNQTPAQGAAADKQIEDAKKNDAIYKRMTAEHERRAGMATTLVGHGAYGARERANGQ